MDPFSLVTGAVGIADVCFGIVEKIRKFHSELAGIDHELRGLADEVESLRDMCRSISEAFADLSPQQLSEKTGATTSGLWGLLRKNMENCNRVVTRLSIIVDHVCSSGVPDKRGGGLRDAYGKVTRKKKHDDELRHCRNQLDTYRKGLDLLFSIVIMYVGRKSAFYLFCFIF